MLAMVQIFKAGLTLQLHDSAGINGGTVPAYCSENRRRLQV